jgi:uroporphyrinogen III methyltransferase/synthase
MNSNGPPRLKGCSIAITRPPRQAGELKQLVEDEGGRAVLFPTIDILPPEDWTACDKAIDGLHMTDGLLFTSPNGAVSFIERVRTKGADPASLRGKRIYSVGDATTRALAGYGLSVTGMPERFTAADLARTISSDDLKGLAFLFPTGNLTPPALAESVRLLGASVEVLIVYRTAAPAAADVEAFFRQVRDGHVDWITFTSPSTVNNFAQLFSGDRAATIRSMTRIAVIGPTTARAAEEAGFPPEAVAARSSAKDLVEAVCSAAPSRRR